MKLVSAFQLHQPCGIYVETVQPANLNFRSGMLPAEGRMAKLVGRVGVEIDVEVERKAAQLAALEAIVEVE